MKKFIKEWGTTIAFLLVIIGIGTFLRFYKINHLPVFADEAIYIRWAQVMKNEPTLRFVPLSDGKQPLYMWLVIPFLKIFSDPLVAGRAVSAMAGVGSMIGIFSLSYLLFKSKKVSLVSVLLYAVSTFTFFFDRMALVDALLSMFGIWVLFFATLTVKYAKLDFAMLTGFSLGGALLTKSPALFYSLLVPLTLIFIDFKKNFKTTVGKLIKTISLFVPTYVIGYGLYNILRLGPNFNMMGSRNLDYVFPLSHLWFSPKDPFLPFLDRSFEWISQMGPWPLLVLAVGAIILNIRKNWKETLLLISWFILPILVQSEFAKVFTARYILFSLPYLIILAGSIFLGKNKIIEKIAVVVVILTVFLSMKFNYLLYTDLEKAPLPRSERSGYLEEWTSGTGITEVATFIKERHLKNPNERIVIGTEGFFGTLPDGLQIYLTNIPNVTVIGVGVSIDRVPEQLINSKKAGDTTYLLFNSSRFKVTNPEKNGLELVAAYPKAFRPDNIKEYVQNGPRDNLLFYELTDYTKAIKK